MFYKKENNDWKVGSRIALPSGELLSNKNQKNIDGWKWHSEPPEEYLKWKLKNGFKNALLQKNKPKKIIDLKTLIISDEVIENRLNKTFSVAIYVDKNFYFIEDLSYKGLLTDSEIKEEVVKFLKLI